MGQHKRLAAAVAAAVAALSGFASQTAYADETWTGTTGDFNVATNWSAGSVPTGTNAITNNGGIVLIQPGDPTWSVTDLRAGDSATGNGTYIQTGSTATLGGWLRLGDNTTGSSGLYQISSGTLNVLTGEINVGEQGTGTFNQSGGQINVASGPIQIAAATGASGVMNLTGGVFNSSTAQLWVGQAGNGTLNINGAGSMTIGTWIALGRTGGTGVINLGPGGSLAMTNSTTHITFAGTTNVLNMTGGTLTTTASDMWVGEGTTSTWNMSGGNAYLLGLELGNNSGSTGTVNLTGGVISTSHIFKGAGTGNFYFNGGTLTAANASNASSFFAGLSSATVNAASTINTNGYGITIGQSIGHNTAAGATDGGLVLTGGGTITLTGLNTYLGNTDITNLAALNLSSSGTALAGIAGPIVGGAPINITAGNGALGSNANTYTGALNVASGATLVFGTGGTTGALSPNGTLQFTPGANVGFDRSDAVTFATGSATDAAPNGTFSGSGKIVQAGTGTLTIGALNAMTGGVAITNTGTVVYTPATITGPIALGGGGTLLYPAGTTTDVTAANGLSLNASGGHVNTSSNNVTFANAVTGTNLGPIYKAGTGNLTLDSTLAPTNVFVNQGSLVLPTAGSAITANSYASIGQAAGDNGTLSLDNGAHFNNSGNDFNIADVGGTTGFTNFGTLTVADTSGAGTSLVTSNMYVGKGTSTTANLAVGLVNQTGGTVTNSSLRVGGFGTGTYNLIGGTLNVGSSQDCQIGSAIGSVGLINVSGGSMALAGNFQPGASGNGTLLQSAGTITHTGGYFSIGRNAGGVGVYNMSGGNFLDTGHTTIVGEQGNGTLLLSGTANFNASLGLVVGNPDGTSSTGLVNQSGGTITAPTVVLGNGANSSTAVTATYMLNGGKLITGGISQPQTTSNVVGTLMLNGGTIQSSASNTSFFTGIASITVGANGLVFNTNTFSDMVSRPLAHDPTAGAPAVDGGVTVTGGGVLTLMAANTYTGTTGVTNGTLAGTGSVAGPLLLTGTISNFASVAPGNGAAGSIGTFTAGPTTFGADSDFIADLSGATSDLLAVNGNLTLTGGTDDITFTGMPNGTSTYVLATYTGTETGAFAPTNLPAGYAINYGTPGEVLLTPAAVPEPASASVLILVGMGLARRRRRA